MKRILIFLLLLAVAAGGLFAQVNWGGSVYAGLGMSLLSGDDEEAVFGIWSNDLGAAAYRGQVNASYTNADGTAGGTIQLRGQGNSSGVTISSPVAYGWMTFADGLLKVLGGRISNSELNAVDTLHGGSLYNTGWGLQTYVYPADVFKFGVGVKTGTGSESNALTAGLKLEDFVGWLGLTAELDQFSANAQLSYQKDDANALISAGFYGIDVLELDAYADFSNLTEFGDAGELDAGVYVGYTGVDKLYAYVYANPLLSMVSDDDLFLAFGAGCEYEVNDVVTPGVDVEFVLQGGEYDGLFSYDYTMNKDNSYLGIAPWVKFSASSRASITLGYNIGVDLSKVDPSNGKKGGLNHAAYINFAFTF